MINALSYLPFYSCIHRIKLIYREQQPTDSIVIGIRSGRTRLQHKFIRFELLVSHRIFLFSSLFCSFMVQTSQQQTLQVCLCLKCRKVRKNSVVLGFVRGNPVPPTKQIAWLFWLKRDRYPLEFFHIRLIQRTSRTCQQNSNVRH